MNTQYVTRNNEYTMDIDEIEFRDEVRMHLQEAIDDYLTFATVEDLLKLIANRV